MNTRPLGKSELSLSEVTLGTWGLADGSYGPVERATFEATVQAALDMGVMSFDMAPLWGDGLSEQVVAKVVGSRRDAVFYVTRAGYARVDGRLEERFDADGVRASCEASLARLGTDRVDLLLLHDPPHWAFKPSNDAWAKALAGLHAEGMVRAWGVSVSTADEARQALGLGASTLCLPYHLLSPYVLDELLEDLENAGAGVVARSPLMHGLLTDRYDSDHRFGEDDHRRARWTPEALRLRVDQMAHLRFLVHDAVSHMTSAALRFALTSPYVSTVAVGARNPAQIRGAVVALRPSSQLPEADAVRLPQVLAATGA